MASRPRCNAVAALTFFLCFCTLGSGSAAKTLTAGDPAPAFCLPDIWGERTLASDSLISAESCLLVIIWNTECPDCLAAVVSLSDQIASTDSLSLNAVGICTDGEAIGDARRFVRAMKLPFPNLWDANRAVAAAYGAAELSFSAFLVDAEWTEALFDAILSLATERPRGDSERHQEVSN
jgi:peroxiredoxin